MAAHDVIYGFFNLVDQTTTEFTGETENAFYPASNVRDPRSTKVYRSTTTTGAVIFDFKTAEDVDLICLRPDLDNGWALSGDVTIEGNSTSNFTSPAYTTTITPDQSENFAYKVLAEAETYRYWRVSGSSSSFFELSNVFIGSKYQAERNASLNWNYSSDDLSKVIRNEDGQHFIDENPLQKNIDFNIKVLTKDGMEAFEDNINNIGIKKPLWLIMDNELLFSNDQIFNGMFYLTKKPSYRNIAFGYFDTSLSIREAR